MTELRRVDEDLDALKKRLAVMSSLAEEQVRVAVDALLSGDRALTVGCRRAISASTTFRPMSTTAASRCWRFSSPSPSIFDSWLPRPGSPWIWRGLAISR